MDTSVILLFVCCLIVYACTTVFFAFLVMGYDALLVLLRETAHTRIHYYYYCYFKSYDPLKRGSEVEDTA